MRRLSLTAYRVHVAFTVAAKSLLPLTSNDNNNRLRMGGSWDDGIRIEAEQWE